MSRPSRNFKDTQVYGWDMEPKDERPSEFSASTGYSVLSGYQVLPDREVQQLRRRRGMGMTGVLVAVLAVLGVGTAALVAFLHMVRG